MNYEHHREHPSPSQAPSGDLRKAPDTASNARPGLHLATINAGSSSKDIPAFVSFCAFAITLLELSSEESI